MSSRCLFASSLLIAVALGCSKNEEPTPAGSPSAKILDAAAKVEKTAPEMTPERFFAEPPSWTIEGIPRGLWTSVDGAPFVQSCRIELGMTMMRVGKIREAAKAAAAATKCESRGQYAVCTFSPPDADLTNPDSQASWIFVADDDSDETIMMAVLIGAPGEWAEVEPTLPVKTACPRPSDDP